MMMRFASMAACLALALPVVSYGQTVPEEEDGTVDLDAIDSLFGDTDVAEEEDPEITDDEGESDDETGEETEEDKDGEEDADEESSAEEGEGEDESEEPEISDLTRAFNGYSLCASEAAAELEETGFTLDVIGEEALLRCSGQRAAYVNAFFFELGPRSPDAGEAAVRASAERLVAQTDTALIGVVTGEVTALREERVAAAEAEAVLDDDAESPSPEEGDDEEAPNEDAAPDDEEASDGESDEEETDPDA